MPVPPRPAARSVLPLAEAKLAVPASRRHVDRPRVRQALDDGREAALTLVAAPAGYGKTTAVRAWCESLDAALAWVTLDAGDNDPIRLWTYIATAVDRVRQGLGRAALQQLGVSGSLNERSVDALMNGLAAFAEPLVIVLDDLHVVAEPECLAAIDYALERLPANARMVAITRADPALRLAQLRAGGKLKEVRAGELAFTVAEARELLVEHFRVELGEEEIALLNERAEGWPAALVLAGLWLQSVDDPDSSRARVRRYAPLRRRVPEQRGLRVARRRPPFVPPGDRGAGAVHRRALRGRARALRCGVRPDRARALEPVPRSGWSGVAGSGSTRSSPSSPLLASPRSSPVRQSGSTSGPPPGSGLEGWRSKRSSTRPRRATTSPSRSSSTTTTCSSSEAGRRGHSSAGSTRCPTTSSRPIPTSR